EFVEPHLRLEMARVVVSLDSDFLNGEPDSLRYARNFTQCRHASGGEQPNRLYVAESTPTVTGSNADHRLPLNAREIERLAYALGERLGRMAYGGKVDLPPAQERWLAAVAEDLKKNRDTSVVLVGKNQPASVHALTSVVNQTLGNIGQTIFFTDSAEASPIIQ